MNVLGSPANFGTNGTDDHLSNIALYPELFLTDKIIFPLEETLLQPLNLIINTSTQAKRSGGMMMTETPSYDPILWP